MDYYKEELAKLGGAGSVKFTSELGDTKNLNLNEDSARAIIEKLKADFNI